MSNDTKKYIQDEQGVVYKDCSSHFLTLSPWTFGSDRRVMEQDIGNYKYISYKNACMIVNQQFSSTTEKWEFDGKKYIADAIGPDTNKETYANMIKTLPNHVITIEDMYNPVSLKLVKHKGKIYYIFIIDQYLPRVQAYNLFGEFCQWVGIDKCKPIYCEDDKKYI